jgi:hypothetical protein
MVFSLLVLMMILIMHRTGLLIEKGYGDGRDRMGLIVEIITNLLPKASRRRSSFRLEARLPARLPDRIE